LCNTCDRQDLRVQARPIREDGQHVLLFELAVAAGHERPSPLVDHHAQSADDLGQGLGRLALLLTPA
jgi:hypothetical protein